MATAIALTRRPLVFGVLAIVVAFATVVRLRPGSDSTLLAFDNLTELGIAVIAAGCCAWRATRTSGRSRTSWLLLAGATGGWACGQAIWSYYELVSNHPTPFPSIADVGFLAFPALALPALLVRPSAALAQEGRARLLLDGTMVAAALFNLSWATSLGAVYRSGGDSPLALGVGLAYPASDVVLLTTAVLVFARSRIRSGLLAFCGGLLGMAVADSAFSYFTAAGTYHTGSYIDIGWVGAFALIGISALTADREDSHVEVRIQPASRIVLPYVMVAVGLTAAVVSVVRMRGDLMAPLVAAVSVATVLVRQSLTLLDNRKLMRNVAAQQDELTYQAFHDPLTGLANRALFYDRVQHAMDLHRRDLRPVSVMFCDIDDFKPVNDTLGHAAGDAVLVATAERLRAVVRAGDTIARLGGDEFGLLIEDDGDPTMLAARLLDAFAIPVRVAGRDIPLGLSVGISSVDPADPPIDGTELIRRADVAMYAAKRAGKATAMPYRSAMSAEPANDLDLHLALAADVAAGTVRTALQPIVRPNGEVYAYEALARWDYQDAPVSPAVFIPVADRAGLLGGLDMLMLRNAVRWAASSYSDALVTVNVGVSNLPDPSLPSRIARVLDEFGLPAERLVIEVPEDQVLSSEGSPRILSTLRRIGVKLALDDFGVGYSCLSRLGTLQPDIVKLDRSFVIPLDDPDAPGDVLAGIIELAHRVGAVVVAEGVETEQQLVRLSALGCDALQGFLLGRPTELPRDWTGPHQTVGAFT